MDSTSNPLHSSLDLARRLYGRVAMRDWRSHHAIRMCVAQLGLAVREARRDPVAVNANAGAREPAQAPTGID